MKKINSLKKTFNSTKEFFEGDEKLLTDSWYGDSRISRRYYEEGAEWMFDYFVTRCKENIGKWKLVRNSFPRKVLSEIASDWDKFKFETYKDCLYFIRIDKGYYRAFLVYDNEDMLFEEKLSFETIKSRGKTEKMVSCSWYDVEGYYMDELNWDDEYFDLSLLKK